ncbi:MAG: xylose isomerase [Planctomycetes bacterium]|nr:xylose isomerase [Planctomycetota bacterium]
MAAKSNAHSLDPRPAHKFSFGLWTVGNPGRDPFGAPVRPVLAPTKIVELLAEVGAYGVNLHDEDLVPIDASAKKRDAIVAEFKQALSDHGIVVPMATTNLFGDPVFKDGAFTSNDARVRAFALQKTARAIELGVELGASTYVFWGGREGVEAEAGKDPLLALQRFRDALNWLTGFCIDRGYQLRFALEAKPNEPRGDIYLPTTGAMLGFIATLEHPEMVGVNPEVAHERMAGLSFVHALAQAHDAGKLFHVDLNDQAGPRYDQDLRFGSSDLKGAFFLVRFLEDCGYGGPRHFDAHAYRTEDVEGVKDFARGCMRTYLALAQKSKRMQKDAEIQGLLAELSAQDPAASALLTPYSKESGKRLLAARFDRATIASRGMQYEKLDQLVTELLLGLR